MSEYILLLHKKHKFIAKRGIVNTHVGKVDISNVDIGKKLVVGTESFMVLKPTFMDLLEKCKRGAQIVMPKDAAQIVAVAGLGRGWKCLDGGSGSGFLAIFWATWWAKREKSILMKKEKSFTIKSGKMSRFAVWKELSR
ncbi:MAG: hypothetical protein U9O96_02725 [Candidatus Thermoplasmatota archaeon]|nr:hypothetical protein [Candidatus Thermoplasmatota archaeon]